MSGLPNYNMLFKIKNTDIGGTNMFDSSLPTLRYELTNGATAERLFNKTIDASLNTVIISSQQLSDGSGVAHLDGVETLTTKTIIDAKSNIVARGLCSNNGNVITSTYSSLPPTAGQVLTASSATTAVWATPGASSGRKTYMLYSGLVTATDTSWTTVAYFSWLNSRFSTYMSGTLIYSVMIPSTTLDVQFIDATANVVLGSDLGIGTSGIRSLSIINPTADARIEFQVRKTSTGGPDPLITGIELEYG